jgi:hypothetical protein
VLTRLPIIGLTGIEIAEKIRMPPAISRAWHCRGFYGSVSHNVKVSHPAEARLINGSPPSSDITILTIHRAFIRNI